jgi:TonB-linked SusC/RagA family outer membrane protein
MSRLRWLLAVLLGLAVLPSGLFAQNRGTISGQVLDDATNQPLSNVQIFVPGTSLGTLTNQQGRFMLVNVPTGTHEVRANRVGFTSGTQRVTVAEGQTATADFRLSATAVALDEIVVTGTAGAVQRKAQPATVASIDASEQMKTSPVSSVQDLLAARVPGVQLSGASGTSGGGQQIRIRGASSISLSNEPLVFVDGVRLDSRNMSDGNGGIWTGGQSQSRLFDINPEDIESIEVVKGPAAATLYGADASAGVIQIITKKGRTGQNRFTQNISLEYNQIDPNFTPFTGYAKCTAALIAISNSLCAGKTVDDVITDSPLEREGVFRNGSMRSLGYSARGGGDSYGYYVSFGLDNEDGTLPNNSMERRTGRANFNFIPHSTLSIDAGVGLTQNDVLLPMNDNNVYGFLGAAYLGRPTTVRIVDGKRTGGTYDANRTFEAIAAIESVTETFRVLPSVQVSYTPFDWFNNRVTLGGDFARMHSYQFYPKNDKTWYQGDANLGDLEEVRTNVDVVTLDYIGTARTRLRDNITSDFSFGVQLIDNLYDRLSGFGTGFVTNTNRVIGSASQISSSQGYSHTRQVGFLGQADFGFNDRFFVQFGGRVDQFSSFGENAEPFFLPKIGASYVISDEPFWDGVAGVIPTLRLRAAFGQTGRSPSSGASLETYSARPYAIVGGSGSGSGVVPLNPGNHNLKAERGSEFEAGFDAGFLQDRIGVELTYFNKVTTDLLLRKPMPPSTGFIQGASSNPFVNIGEVRNAGLEYSLRGTLISNRNIEWEARLAGSTLDNELVSLGDIEAYGVSPRYSEGRPVGYYSTQRVREVITATGDSRCPKNTAGQHVACTIVSDTNEYVGPSLPTNQGSFGSTLTLMRNLQITGLLEWQRGHRIYNNTQQFRDRSFGTSELAVYREKAPGATQEEVLRKFGPFVSETPDKDKDGNPVPRAVPHTAVNEEYYERADFVRLRELAATFFLPERFAQSFGASSASLTVGGRNLALWTDYSGADPEVLSAATGTGTSFLREDFFTVPQPRRVVLKMNFTF